jgi:hypothetical protein
MSSALIRQPFRGPSAAAAGSLALLLLVGLAGCGGSLGQVTGKITHQGQSVGRAEVVFSLENEPAEVFYGASNDEGVYALDVTAKDGLPPGKYDVVVTDYTLPGGQALPAGEAGASLRDSDRVVVRRTKLSKDVAAGDNQIDLKLEEGQPMAADQ